MIINKHYLCLCHNFTFGRHLAYSTERNYQTDQATEAATGGTL